MSARFRRVTRWPPCPPCSAARSLLAFHLIFFFHCSATQKREQLQIHRHTEEKKRKQMCLFMQRQVEKKGRALCNP
ncbi:hypothetical protein BC940DRAFT_312805 [Gongronella butleri]|nr:hypothetical protein BC940DRAFT_312805 [Gongronella butleri]